MKTETVMDRSLVFVLRRGVPPYHSENWSYAFLLADGSLSKMSEDIDELSNPGDVAEDSWKLAHRNCCVRWGNDRKVKEMRSGRRTNIAFSVND
ncbi:MAG: hypothetical protein ABJJ37_15040 [Roseibium sp.]